MWQASESPSSTFPDYQEGQVQTFLQNSDMLENTCQ